MMDFFAILEHDEFYRSYNPYAAKSEDGEWIKGYVYVDFLNEHFRQYSTADEMINAIESEGLKMYFAWLKEQGILD